MARETQNQFGRYRILSQLGQGGMATVYLAEDPSLSRLVAIKVIQPHLTRDHGLLQRFSTEARTIAALRNTNIVEVFDFDIQDGRQYIVMEYMDGPNLGQVCSSFMGTGLPVDIAVSFICQAAEGLIAAEKKNVVHRDIKPENLMINSEGCLKIADFGIAHLSEDQSLTATGDLLGSPHFMAPEQIEGKKPTAQTDLWALGCILYYTLSGKLPFKGANITATLRKISDSQPEPLSTDKKIIPEELVTLCFQLLEKDPELRPASATVVVTIFRHYLASNNVTDLQECIQKFLKQIEPQQLNTIVESTPSPGTISTFNKSDKETAFSKTSWMHTRKAPVLLSRSGKNHKRLWAITSATAILFMAICSLYFFKFKKTIAIPEFPLHSEQESIHIEKIIFEQPDQLLKVGETTTLNITTLPSGTKDSLLWTSTDSSVVTVNDGVIEAKKVGQGIILVTSKRNPLVDAICRIKITEPANINPIQKKSSPNILKEGLTKSEKYGELFILSAPPFANIRVNGVDWGSTPMSAYRKIPAGKVKVEIIHRLHAPVDSTFIIKPKSAHRLKFNLNS